MLFMYLPDLSFAVVFAAPIFALNVNPTLIVANYFEGCGIFLDQLKILATDQTNFTDFDKTFSLHPEKYMLQKQTNIYCRIREIQKIHLIESEKYYKLIGNVTRVVKEVTPR